MKVGITGQQNRAGMDWTWVCDVIQAEIGKMPPPVEGISSLAEGADQIFAEAILSLGASLRAIIPKSDYLRHFRGAGRERYLALRSRAEVEELQSSGSDEQSFFAAGKHIVDEADLMIAVWDGEPAQGLGGTGDVVHYALARRKPVIHIDPIKRRVTRLR
jgi:hypothetical protein